MPIPDPVFRVVGDGVSAADIGMTAGHVILQRGFFHIVQGINLAVFVGGRNLVGAGQHGGGQQQPEIALIEVFGPVKRADGIKQPDKANDSFAFQFFVCDILPHRIILYQHVGRDAPVRRGHGSACALGGGIGQAVGLHGIDKMPGQSRAPAEAEDVQSDAFDRGKIHFTQIP